jgi:hypothetical protein
MAIFGLKICHLAALAVARQLFALHMYIKVYLLETLGILMPHCVA